MPGYGEGMAREWRLKDISELLQISEKVVAFIQQKVEQKNRKAS